MEKGPWYLRIDNADDRETVAKILLKNGYSVQAVFNVKKSTNPPKRVTLYDMDPYNSRNYLKYELRDWWVELDDGINQDEGNKGE